MTAPWPLEHRRGSAVDFHALELLDPMRRALWWFEVTERAVVLGSTQADVVVDRPWAEAHHVEVARRRSGGGAVWLAPGEVTWVDVLLPAGDDRWDDDVVRAASWLGEAWAEVLERLGIGEPEVHHGGLVSTPWSRLVCFAGIGPGEVTVGGQKVVGISQRRTRAGARFQCALLHRWDPVPLARALALGPHAEDALAPLSVGIEELTGVPHGPAEVVAALAGVLAAT